MLVGFSKKCITPPDSCRMAGFDLRKQPSQGVLDDLYVSCVALQPDKGAPFAFLSFDLLGVPREECRRIEEELKTSCGFYNSTRIWISATHTQWPCQPLNSWNRPTPSTVGWSICVQSTRRRNTRRPGNRKRAM